jgi:hypothetical protein
MSSERNERGDMGDTCEDEISPVSGAASTFLSLESNLDDLSIMPRARQVYDQRRYLGRDNISYS